MASAATRNHWHIDDPHAARALDELVNALGLDDVTPAPVTIADGDPVLASRYRLAAAAGAGAAAVGVAAQALCAGHTSKPPAVHVNARHAVAALRAYRYLRCEGAAPPSPFDPLTGFYPTADRRWIYFHCNFPRHRDGVLRLLDSACNAQALAQRTAAWNGAELEHALARAGLCGGLARTSAEWSNEAQAIAIENLPPIEVLHAADSPVRPRPATKQFPLSGIRVLDLTRVLAGPSSTRVLAELGAQVLRITGPELADSGPLDWDTGLGKRNAFIDLDRRDGAARLHALIREADVYVQAYRPEALGARGFDERRLAEEHPGLIVATLSAFGHVGPWAARRGFDTVVQTVSGMAAAECAEERPVLMPVSAIDYVAGFVLAAGVMSALRRRASVGGSYLVRTSLAQIGRWIVRRGTLERQAWREVHAEFASDELAAWCDDYNGPLGATIHLGTPLELDGRRVRQSNGPWPLGAHAPLWTS